ncbi:MAG TPA: Rrf2 family transcriptional regulator [Vicinamibacteria bacterium]|nr:Rrf2 family transcriptional regulator [Vicinamibacteria bacterium]
MRIANRFSIGVHILSLLGALRDAEHTSEWMAGSIGVNPVVVRNVTGMLRRAGLVRTQQGVAGARLARPLSKVTLLDVYRAVEDETSLFSLHPRPNPKCPVGARIEGTLREVFAEAEDAMHAKLAGVTMEQLVRRLGPSSSARRRA